ncbi:hypothetical protein [Streptosporangium carneum]|uniref:Uncharacterized protein n=1 Tax=Streptosporangium carneum TaxID=47481 RepID=A0A9W6HXY8_9ACTN|nr:hypothetical protein [Streptosporangium carneum]GLK08137.1 hypothetical protein GCM10017600_15420 [Streptosporangium carneum]
MTVVSSLPAPVIAEATGGRLELAVSPEVVQVLTDCGYPVEGGDTVTLTVGVAGRYRDAVVLSVGSLILGAAQMEGYLCFRVPVRELRRAAENGVLRLRHTVTGHREQRSEWAEYTVVDTAAP